MRPRNKLVMYLGKCFWTLEVEEEFVFLDLEEPLLVSVPSLKDIVSEQNVDYGNLKINPVDTVKNRRLFLMLQLVFILLCCTWLW